jgi:uncharacterized protein YhjY with autotransporter beta-barrel domain
MSMNYRCISVDDFQETDNSGGGMALTYDDQTIEGLRSILGFNILRSLSRDFGV